MLKDYRRDLAGQLLGLRRKLSSALDDPSRPPALLGSLMVACSGLDREIEAVSALPASEPSGRYARRVAEAIEEARSAAVEANTPEELDDAFDELRASLTALHLGANVADNPAAAAHLHMR